MPDPVGTEHRARRRIAPLLIALTIPVVAAAQTATPVCAAHRGSYLAIAEHAGAWSSTYYRLRKELADCRGDSSALAEWTARFRCSSMELGIEEARKLDLLARRRKAPRARHGASRRNEERR